jgi:hypothetical protein
MNRGATHNKSKSNRQFGHRCNDISRTTPPSKGFCPSWSCVFLFPSIICQHHLNRLTKPLKHHNSNQQTTPPHRSTCLPTSDPAAPTRPVTSAPSATPRSRPSRRPTASTRARRTLTRPTTPVCSDALCARYTRIKKLTSDTEDERSIANQLERETKREKEPSPEPKEVTESKKDATLPVCHFTSPLETTSTTY